MPFDFRISQNSPKPKGKPTSKQIAIEIDIIIPVSFKPISIDGQYSAKVSEKVMDANSFPLFLNRKAVLPHIAEDYSEIRQLTDLFPSLRYDYISASRFLIRD